MIIRTEEKNDHREVEHLVREAFWNEYEPGANEHYLLHTLRMSSGFIPALNLVAETEGSIVAQITYSLSVIKDKHGVEHQVITFGPVSVLPAYQGKGIGAQLIKHSIQVAKELGYRAIVIYGYPDYYQRLGFRPGKAFNICSADGLYRKALMVMELYPNALDGIEGHFFEDPLFDIDAEKAEEFDAQFPPKEKKSGTESQKRFEITSQLIDD